MRVLIIEDDESSRRGLALLVRKAGFEVLTAGDLAQGKRLLETAPDALIVDLLLPDGSGIELLRLLRQRGQSLPVAVISGADDHMLSEAATFGPALFGKPIDIKEFQTWLREVQLGRAGPFTQSRHKPTWN